MKQAALYKATIAMLEAEDVDRIARLLEFVHKRHRQCVFTDAEAAALESLAGAITLRMQAEDEEFVDPFAAPAPAREEAERQANPKPKQPPRDYALTPEGPATLTVRNAYVGEVPWNSEEHVRITLTAGIQYRLINDNIALSKTNILGMVARAFGLRSDDLKTSPAQIEGQTVAVVIKHVTRKNGELMAVVGKWVPKPGTPEEAPAQKTPRPKRETAPRQMPNAAANAQKLLAETDDLPW